MLYSAGISESLIQQWLRGRTDESLQQIINTNGMHGLLTSIASLAWAVGDYFFSMSINKIARRQKPENIIAHYELALKVLAPNRPLKKSNTHYMSYEAIVWSILRAPLFPEIEAGKFVPLSKDVICMPSCRLSMPNNQFMAWRTDTDTVTNFPILPTHPPNTTLYYHWCELGKNSVVVPDLIRYGVRTPRETVGLSYTFASSEAPKDFGIGFYVTKDFRLLLEAINEYYSCTIFL